MGVFLPNEPIENTEIEDYLGKIDSKPSKVKDRILKQNGIKQRYFALNLNQESTHSNTEMASNAIREAIKKSSLREQEVEMIASGTTQADLPVPGFASMIHAALNYPKCELSSFQSVCASGVMALKNVFLQIKSNDKTNGIVVGSEFSSRLFKSSRFEAQNLHALPFDAEFLRWMLSDGAGAMVLQNKRNAEQISLKVEWVEIQSNAPEFPVCMYTGKIDNKNELEKTWLDYPDYESASKAGALNLKQDIRLLDNVVKKGVSHFFELIDKKMITADEIDWFCCHYSSEFFKEPIKELLLKGGANIPEENGLLTFVTKVILVPLPYL